METIKRRKKYMGFTMHEIAAIKETWLTGVKKKNVKTQWKGGCGRFFRNDLIMRLLADGYYKIKEEDDNEIYLYPTKLHKIFLHKLSDIMEIEEMDEIKRWKCRYTHTEESFRDKKHKIIKFVKGNIYIQTQELNWKDEIELFGEVIAKKTVWYNDNGEKTFRDLHIETKHYAFANNFELLENN